MKITRRSFLAAAAWTPLLAQAVRAAMTGQGAGGERLLYVGTYTNNAAGSKGIYAWRFNAATGAVTSLGLAAETDSPSWVAVHPNKRFLYAANELPPAEAGGPEGAITAFAIDQSTGQLTRISRSKSKGLAPAHLIVDPTGNWIVVANYGSANGREGTSVATFAVGADGRLAAEPKAFMAHTGKPDAQGVAGAAHPHCVLLSPDGKFLFVAEKGRNEITIYRWNAATGELAPHDPGAVDIATVTTPTTARAAPRHLTFGKDGRFLYCAYEAGRAVSTFAYDGADGTLTALDTHPTLPADAPQSGSCAEIEVHPDGTFLYVSNRGHNTLALFAIDQAQGTLQPRGHFPTGGTPRHFKIDPSGDYVFTEGQNTSVTLVQKIDRRTGALTQTDARLDSPAPVCIAFV
jgi:6-phosphogluconolactonase